VSKTKSTWNAWDVPYFGGRLKRRLPTVEAPPRGPGLAPTVLPLADGGSKVAERIFAVLIAIGGVVGGAAVAGGFLMLAFVFSFGDSADGTDLAFAFGLGGAVVVYGVAMAILIYHRAGLRDRVELHDGALAITYKTFKRPLIVPRSLLRVASIDGSKTSRFGGKRFPIEGAVPEGSFADALDNYPSLPWEDLDPDRHDRKPTPGVVLEDFGRGPRLPGGYAHDDPASDGWASRAKPVLPAPVRQAFLWSGDGASLPFLRIGAGDVPNLALIFHEPQHVPRAPLWMMLSPLQRGYQFWGGRTVRGLLMRVVHPDEAHAAFEAWGVARPVTATDVVEEGLLVAKPLTGRRALIFGVTLAVSLFGPLIFRLLR
jgi:hypothetical protein